MSEDSTHPFVASEEGIRTTASGDVYPPLAAPKATRARATKARRAARSTVVREPDPPMGNGG